MKKKLLAALVMTVALLMGAPASAGEATNFVRKHQNELFEVIAQPKSPSRQSKLRAKFDEMLAYDELARGSLGKKWDDRSAAEQKKFSGLLTQLVRNNYKRNLLRMLDYDIRYVGEEGCDGKGCPAGTVLVKTRAKHKSDKREPEVEIDFRIKRIGGSLMVVDIVTERASLVKTYRSQFLRILRKDGFDRLISKMEKKLAEQEDTP